MALNKRMLARGIALILLVLAISINFAEENNNPIILLNETNTTNETTIIPASITVWDSADSGMPNYNGAAYKDETFSIFTQYNSTENDEIITDATCTLTFQGLQINLNFNSETKSYISNLSYPTPSTYNYLVSCEKQGYESKTGAGTIEIKEKTTDNDNDGYPAGPDCNDNNPNINPGKQEILYNEIDDDCNSQTIDILFVELSVDKSQYNVNEVPAITINANLGTDAYLTVSTPFNISYVYIFSNSTYPKIHNFNLTQKVGNYDCDVIIYSGNHSITKEISFNVISDFSAEISRDKSVVFYNDDILFTAQVTGGKLPFTYEWNFDDGTKSTEKNPVHNFASIRSYNVIFKVKDANSNEIIKTMAFDAQNRFALSFYVYDNTTGSIIKNAKVKLGNDVEYTDTRGYAGYEATNMTYSLKISASGYNSYHEDIKVNNSRDLKYYLEPESDDLPPLITILSPLDNTNIESGYAEFRFKVYDSDPVDCTLYLYKESSWKRISEYSAIKTSSEIRHEEALNTGDYKWKAECEDMERHTATTKEYRFSILGANAQDETLNLENTKETIAPSSTVQEVFDLLPDFAEYSPDQKRVVELLNIEDTLKALKVELERDNNNLFNLRYKKDAGDYINERQKVLNDITRIKDIAPRAVNVIKKSEFIKYSEDFVVEELLKKYTNLKKKEYSKNFIANNVFLQKKASINTIAYLVQIEYVSGRGEELTVIERNIESANLGNLLLIEFFPQEISKDDSEIKIISKATTKLDSGIYERDLSDSLEFAYIIKKSVNLDEIPKISSIIISEEYSAPKENAITGFSVFNSIGIEPGSKVIFGVELTIIVILAAIYIGYTVILAQPKNKENLEERQTEIAIVKNEYSTYVEELIEECNNELLLNRKSNAIMKYKEIEMLYPTLDETQKKKSCEKITEVGKRIIVSHMNSLIDSCYINLSKNELSSAIGIYTKIELEYRELSDELRNTVFAKCAELFIAIQGVQMMQTKK